MMDIIILEHSGYDLVVLNKDGWIYLHTIIYPIQKKCFKTTFRSMAISHTPKNLYIRTEQNSRTSICGILVT